MTADACAQRGEGIVRDEAAPTQPQALERAVDACGIARPVDVGEREYRRGDVIASDARVPKRALDRECDLAHGALQPQTFPVRSAGTTAAEHNAVGAQHDGIGLGRTPVDPDHGPPEVSIELGAASSRRESLRGAIPTPPPPP